MFEGWVHSIPNVRYPKVGPRLFTVERMDSACGAGPLDSHLVQIARGVVHETQTSVIPSYSGTAPNFTIGPKTKGGPWTIVQHIPCGFAACALLHPSGSPETNRITRIQVELCGYTTRDVHLPDAPPEGLALIESFFEWCQHNMAIPEHYPYNPKAMATGLWASVHNPWRDSKTWEDVPGWHPHAAVDDNMHWDVGGLDVSVLLRQEPMPKLVRTYALVELWRLTPTDSHDHLEEIVRPRGTLTALFAAAAKPGPRKAIRRALATKGHRVRIVRHQVPA